MDNFGQLRIYVSKKYFPIFHEMSRSKLFSQNSEFFVFCVFVGEKYDKKNHVENRHELCRAVTLNQYDIAALKALYLNKKNALQTIKDTIELAETYADGGMEYLIENILAEVTYKDEDGHWHIKSGVNHELQVKLFDFVLEEKEKVPF